MLNHKNSELRLLNFACGMLLAVSAFSQTITTGDVVGVITDTSGAVVPGATVTIKSAESGETRAAASSGQGQYRFPLLKPGEYVVSASSTGLNPTL